MSGKLVIVRHGESEWNATGQWTGITDVHLTAKGRQEGAKLGEQLRDVRFDHAYVSEQIRTLETLQELLKVQGQTTLPVDKRWALNERDYGEYTGLNKWEVKEKLGETQFQCIRRDFDCPVPGGETLKDVYSRVVPFYNTEIVPEVTQGKVVLIVSHGNAIRALVKYIEKISDADISKIEMIFGTILTYTIDEDGRQITKNVRHIDTTLPPSA
jgi:2,3-bisphosphoglycerate-dependent phosphoglycerate mutase